MIVAGAIFVPRIPANPVSALGDASYSLYLTHIMSLAAVAMVWRHAFASLDWSLFVISGLTASILAAFVVYRGFEVPMTAALKKRFPSRRAALTHESPVTAPAVTEPRS